MEWRKKPKRPTEIRLLIKVLTFASSCLHFNDCKGKDVFFIGSAMGMQKKCFIT